MIMPIEVLAPETLDKIGEVLKEQGIDLDELLESGSEIRQKIYNEKYTREPDES
jgi:hypothetical protein